KPNTFETQRNRGSGGNKGFMELFTCSTSRKRCLMKSPTSLSWQSLDTVPWKLAAFLRILSERSAEVVELNDISSCILGSAFKVHTAIGPGVLESVYQTCLHHELRKAGLRVESQVSLPVQYDGLRMESGYRIDLLVEDIVIVELKCVEA